MRKLIALFALLAMITVIAPTTSVLAAGSPVGRPITDDPGEGNGGTGEEKPTNPGSNIGDKSPHTGRSLTFAYIALVGASGVSLIAKKKITE